MPLTTRCGRCGRLFPIHAQDLRRFLSRVRCPQCGHRFNGRKALIDEPMLAREAVTSRARLGFGRVPGAAATPRGGTGAVPVSAARVPAPRLGLRPAPGLPGPRRLAGRLGGLLGGLAVGAFLLALILALPAQLAWWQRAELLRDPAARDLLADWCARLGCRVPAPRLPGTLAVLAPSLGADPDTGALILSLSMRNDAPLAQPAPFLELEVFGPQGDLAAARRFAPAEYGLPAKAGLLAPDRTLAVTLHLAPLGMEPSGFKVRLL